MLNRLLDILLYTERRLSDRAIAESLEVSKTTVGRYRRLLAERGLPPGKTALQDCSSRELDEHFNGVRRATIKDEPDFSDAAERLKTHWMTKRRLWKEYCRNATNPMGYVQYTRRFNAVHKPEDVVYWHEHAPGEVAFVDYSGDGPSYIDRTSGEAVKVELFVAVLGHSRLMYACCSLTQTVPDWLDTHTRMLEFFGGVPQKVVCDNLKSGVTVPGKVPVIQREFLEWGRYYGVAVLPARAKAPQQKSKVEIAVRNAQRDLLPDLAERKHYSLEQLNAHVTELVTAMNDAPFQKLDGCRRSRFESSERAALKPLPARPFAYFKWVCKAKVPRDYHVPVLRHYYSVPYQLVGQVVEGRVSATTVEIHLNGEVVATHARSNARAGHTTNPEHQHPRHLAQSRRTPENARAWAEGVGPSMARLMAWHFSGKVPLQGLPAALALWDLSRCATPEELEAAAAAALARRQRSPTDVKNFLSDARRLPTDDGRSAVPLRRAPRRATGQPTSCRARERWGTTTS